MKFLGQHFLNCGWVVSAMLSAAQITKDDIILEVGPGTGVLTEALALRAKKVLAVEKDRGLFEKLEKSIRNKGIRNISAIHGDILTILKSYQLSPSYNKVVANIPYYLTSRLFRLLLEKNRPELIVMTIQKEVAERICAQPPKMNLLGISVQIFGTPEIIKIVPRDCFSPPPQVQSAIIKISKISNALLERERLADEDFFRTVKIIFAGRRKTLLNNIATGLGRAGAREVLLQAKIDPKTRAGELSLEKVLGLARAYLARARNAPAGLDIDNWA